MTETRSRKPAQTSASLINTSFNRRTLLKGAAAASGVAALNSPIARRAPWIKRASAQDDGRGTITLLSAEPFFGSWDPSSHTILANIHAEWNCFDRLMALDWETKELKPQLAESWTFVEPTVLELKLRSGVTFHDGSPFGAKDVKASLEYMTSDQVAHRAWYREQLQVEVVDDLTVRIRTQSPYPGLLYTLPVTSIMAEADVNNPDRLKERYNGTGPFKWKDYSQETLTFEANDEYWGGPPQLAGFSYQYVQDPGTRLAALQTGEAHVIERVESEQIPEIEANPDLRVDTTLTTENKWLIFKAKMPPMENKLLRQAISFAIDRDLIVDSILEGHGRVCDAHVAPIFFGYKPQENTPTYDPERAKALLAEAGYPNGEGLDTLVYVTSVGFYPKTREYGQYITQALGEIGINIDFQAKEPAAWLEMLYAETGAHLFDTGWMPPGIDPDLVLKAFFYSGGRITYYDDEKINALLDKEGTADPEERLTIIGDELLPALMEEMPALPLFTSELISGVSNKVPAFKANPNSTWDLKDVSLQE
ncbi:MAG TPA: ABC transporter substrate-binding protein [Thermomicrobiales bacterium]